MDNSGSKKRIQFFNSFDEAEAYEAKKRAQTDPLERMANNVALIKKIYNYKPQIYFRLYIDRYEG